MRIRLLALTVAIVALTPACLVLGLDRFYEDASIVFDERLLGTWRDADDNVTVTLERSDWRAYRLQYVHPTDARVLSAFLFKVRDRTYLDLSPLRGEDAGPFLVPAHTVVRLTITSDEISVAPLDYDWFVEALTKKALPPELQPVRGERNQIVLGAERAALVRWLDGTGDKDPAFGDAVVFRKN